ncbi:MAG: YfhO family protein [Taibaiella sp.]|nr:YfhO family protein [Taibaiella sp.]
MKFDFNKLKIDLLAIVAFVVISLLYCLPQIQGKKLNAHDNISWQGMSHEAMAFHDSTGKDVMWSNSMFGGMPSYTTYAVSGQSNYVGFVQDILEAVGKPAYFFFIAMLCFYLLMRVLGVNKWLGMVGAFAYAFSSYNAIIIGVGHDTKMMTIAYLPAAIAGLYLIYKEKWLTGAALWGFAIALIAINGHYQVIYYYLFIFVCFGLVMFYIALKEGKIKEFLISSVIAVVVGLVGTGPNMTSILPAQEYTKATMRGGASELSGHDKKENGGLDKDYAFRWSNGIGETFCIMIPYLYGGSSGESSDKAPKTYEMTGGRYEKLPLYWGPQPFLSGPVYFGAIVCFLFVLGLMVVKSPHKWWIVAASIIGIVLSWGKNFAGVNYFLFDHLPMLNKFRTPSMAMVVPQFLFPLLGMWAVNDILTKKDNPAEIWKKLKIATGITAGLCLLLGVAGGMFFDFKGAEDAQMPAEIMAALRDDRASLAMKSGLRSAVFILLAAALLYGFIKDKLKPGMLIGGLAAIMVFDLYPVAHTYLNENNFEDAADYEAVFQPRDVDKAIMQDKDPYYRVLDLSKDTYNDAVQAYFHKCVGGYSPAKMEIYQDLIDRHLSKGFNAEVLNMLNTKYIIVGGQKSAPQVMPNTEACGNAWFVDEVKWAATADEEINSLNARKLGDTVTAPGAFQPKKTAVIRGTFQSVMGNYTFGKDSAAYVKLDKYGLNDISFISNNSKPGLAVFSDIYYEKGWKAFVDGNETPIMKADYVLRSIKVPAGNHKIEFHFHPESFYKGKTIAMASSIFLILLGLSALVPLFMKKKEIKEA